MRVVVEIAREEQAGGRYGGDHAGAVQPHFLLPDQQASCSNEHGACAIQAGVQGRKDAQVERHLRPPEA